MTVDDFYPVGSLYETSDNNFDPNVSFGGTWSVVTDACVTVSDPNGTVSTSLGSLVGADTVTLTESQMPAHKHSITSKNTTTTGGSQSSATSYDTVRSGGSRSHFNNSGGSNTWGSGYTKWGNTGSGSAHNNMQPYIGIKRWRRTA